MNVMIYFDFKFSFRDKYPIPLVNPVGILEFPAIVTQVLGQTNREWEQTDSLAVCLVKQM